jgi:GNAT superfamily N-acetyltransferase
MKTVPLETANPEIHLIAPDVERDAPLSVVWLAGQAGRDTLKLMGVTDADNQASTLEAERQRVRDFISDGQQLNWMIQYAGTVVGSIWVDVNPSKHLPSPGLHIMIGDPAVRGKGVGHAAATAVIGHLQAGGVTEIFSRHLVSNSGVMRLLSNLGFVPLDKPYADADNLHWQNVNLQL